MTSRRYRPKADLFSLLIVFVMLGMAATLAYQVKLFYGGETLPIAKQTPAAAGGEAIDG
jgi:hypothetical protein